MTTWTGLQRNARKIKTQNLRDRGITPAKNQFVYCVSTTVIAIPGWIFEQAVPGLRSDSDHIWLRSSRMATYLMKLDRDEGGRPECTRLRARKCRVCGSWRLNLLASERQRLDESGITGRDIPCGPQCLIRRKVRQQGQI